MPWPNKVRVIDLSLPIQNFSLEPQEQEIVYWDHHEFARRWAKNYKFDPGKLPEPYTHAAQEQVTASTHAGTHIDAPWNFGPTSEGRPAKTIDQVPIEWGFGDGVVLDMRHRQKGELITLEDVQGALEKIGYTVKPGDVVLIRTGCDQYFNTLEFSGANPGMSGEATLWLIEQGVKMMGIDAWGFDVPVPLMVEGLRKGDVEHFFPSHYAGRKREYCHAEKLANLDQLPATGFKVCLFPIKVAKAGGAWCRAVALVEEE